MGRAKYTLPIYVQTSQEEGMKCTKAKGLNIEKILKGSLDSIPSPSPSVKIQIMGGKVFLGYKGKLLLVIGHKLWNTQSSVTSPSNVLPYYLK